MTCNRWWHGRFDQQEEMELTVQPIESKAAPQKSKLVASPSENYAKLVYFAVAESCK